MLFSDPIFWIFYAIVLLALGLNQKFVRSVTAQNIILLVASYVFYANWDWRFLSLVVLVSLQTYLFGHLLQFQQNYRKIFLFVSVLINVLVLGYFKYFNFFESEFVRLIGVSESYTLSKIVLPVGISFYIFQTLTYIIDIYFRKIEPDRNWINYFTYVAFFPQLVAGPIERASTLLPQFKELKFFSIDNVYVGLKIAILGLFLKIVIADSLASDVDEIFANYEQLNGGTLLLGAIYFAVQIYGDFCGYSLIAIGVARIIGFRLMRNFETPYFATSIQDFWRRWHISLSTFFRDYVYIPLGGSRLSPALNYRNVLATFVLSGIWHGANWTFMFWGFAHGLLLIGQRVTGIRVGVLGGWLLTMSSVLILWVVFRSESIVESIHYIQKMLADFSVPSHRRAMIFLIPYLVVDIVLLRYKNYSDTLFGNALLEGAFLATLLILVVGTIHRSLHNFIYFQF